jgi:hypothetical protein
MAPKHYLILADVLNNSLEMWIGWDLQCDIANAIVQHRPCRRFRMALLARRKKEEAEAGGDHAGLNMIKEYHLSCRRSVPR